MSSLSVDQRRGILFDPNMNMISGEDKCHQSRASIVYNSKPPQQSDFLQPRKTWAIPQCAVMVLVRDYTETFRMDQLAAVNKLIDRDIPVLISTLADVSASTFEVTADGRLVFTTKDTLSVYQISCLYFRGGYNPADYINDQCWAFVEAAELSKTVLLPSVGLHLAGTKRVQCALAEKDFELLNRLNEQPPDSANISHAFRSTFVEQFELDEHNIKQVQTDVDSFVVKPQREGGTNNLFGDEIVSKFNNVQDKSELSRFIAMRKIKGETVKNYPVRTRDGEVKEIPEAVAEVGSCSVVVVDPSREKGDEILMHEFAGFVTKIKSASSNEAGVSVGHGFLTSLSAIPA